MLGGLAAADAGVAHCLLLEGHAPGGDPGLLLHLQLTLQLTAPHGLGEAALALHEGLDFVQGAAHLGVVLQILFSPLEQSVVDRVQQLLNLGFQLCQGDEDLLAGVPAADAALALLHVLGPDLHTQGDAFHLVLGGLPAHGLVAVVHLGPDARRFQAVQQGGGGVQHALLVLGHGDDDGLDGGDAGGQD